MAHARANVALSLNVYVPRGVLSPHVALRQCMGHFEASCDDIRHEGGVRVSSSLSFPARTKRGKAGQEGGQEVRPPPLVVWVKKQGDARFTKLVATAEDVDDLVEAAVKKLPTLKDRDLSTLTLHVERADGSLGPALDSRARLEDAGVAEGTSMVVKAADTAAGPTPAALVEFTSDDMMTKVARGMLDARVAESSITLPDGVFWPDMDSTVLYVRHFYKDLWDSVLAKGQSLHSNRGAVIMGTPGIGKSAFGLYALYRVVKDGRTVIYAARKGGTAVFKGGKAYKFGGAPDLLDEMSDPATVYISDSLPPAPSRGAFRLLITSPKKDNWSEFSKSPGVKTLVLPIYSKDEILDLRRLAFAEVPGCSEDEVLERFLLWGGNPRNVLTYGTDAGHQARLKAAPSALGIGAMEQALRGHTVLDGVGGTDSIHRLLNLIPLGALPESTLKTSDLSYYEFHHAQLITRYVEGLFAAGLHEKDKAELYRFLHAGSSDPALATLRGRLYERCIVVPRFVHGPGASGPGELPVVRLSPALRGFRPVRLLRGALTLRSGLPLVHFRSVEDLRQKWAADDKNAVFVPLNKEFPVVDFILRVSRQAVLANATVGESHAIKAGNLQFQALLSAVGLDAADQEIPLVWVLDEPAHKRFDKPGPLKSEAGGALASSSGARHPVGRRIAQYKMLLEVPRARPLEESRAIASTLPHYSG